MWKTLEGATLEAFKCLGAEAGNQCRNEVSEEGGICYECGDYDFKNNCAAMSEDGFLCTRPKRHTGPHVAHYDKPEIGKPQHLCATPKWWKDHRNKR